MPQRDETGWIRARLEELGRDVRVIERPHVRPWGTVFRADTDDGVFWCKTPIPALAYELPLLERLGTRDPDRVPRLVAVDRTRGWMLLEDTGRQLRDVHPDGVPLAVWLEFLPVYAELQIVAARDADDLRAAGVPDRRSDTLVDGFLRLIHGHEEQRRLEAAVPQVEEAIAQVAALGLPDSIQHDDLHARNVCVRDGTYRFIDWGDACIAQPLLSLAVPLAHVGDADAARARDAYLEPWTAFAPRRELVAATDAAVVLAQITGALKWELINSAVPGEERAEYDDTIPRRLRRLLEVTCA